MSSAYDIPIDDWMGEGVEVIDVAAFTKKAVAGEYRNAKGMAYPACDGNFTIDFVILPDTTNTIPIDATHVVWFPT